MQAPMLMAKKKVVADSSMVMAMDFEGTAWADSVNPARVYTVYQSNTPPSLTSAYGAKGGTKAFYQPGAVTAGRCTLATPISSDIQFAGDFWIEWYTYFVGILSGTGNRAMQWTYGYWTSGASQGLQGCSIDGTLFSFHDTNNNDSTFTSQHPTAIAQNVWTHLAVGRQGTQLYLFVNGVPNTPVTWSTTLGVTTQPNFAFGGYFDSRLGATNSYGSSTVIMDRFRMYKGKCLYTSAFTPGTGLYPS